MINKKSLWFFTLFSLILVLSIYYITMPSEMLLNNSKIYNKKENNIKDENNQVTVNIEESNLLSALRVESDSEIENEIENLKTVLTDDKTSSDDKNKAYEKIKNLNNTRSDEENLEKKIKDEFNLNTFIKIDGDQIKVTVDSNIHDNSLANKIIKSIQSNFDSLKYISIKFNK